MIWAQPGHGRLDLDSNDGSFVGPLPLHLWSEEKRLTALLVALESPEHLLHVRVSEGREGGTPMLPRFHA